MTGKRRHRPGGTGSKPGGDSDTPPSPPVVDTHAAPADKTPAASPNGIWAGMSALKLFVGGLGISAAGALAYFAPFIEPIKTAVVHWLYEEKATVKLSCDPCIISKGEAARISVEIIPGPSVDVAEGVTRLEFNDAELSLSEDTPVSFQVEPIKSRKLLNQSFVLYPNQSVVSPQISAVTVTLDTKFGTHMSAPLSIMLTPIRADARGPYIEPSGKHRIVLSGEWRLELGGSLGGMRIEQSEKNDITGVYWLNEPTGRIEAAVDGYKDGTSFKVFFRRPAKQSLWRVDANFFTNAVDKGFIEMKGCAYSLRPDQTVTTDSQGAETCSSRSYVGWRGDGATTFWASATLR